MRPWGEDAAQSAVVEDEEVVADNGMLDPADDDVADEGEEERPEDVPFDVRLRVLEDAVCRQSLHREIEYKILRFCEERRDLRVIEEEVAGYPEFAHAVQSQYHMICALEDAGGLRRIELDENGVEEYVMNACPSCGSCSGMYTANSMNCLTEAIGMGLRGNGTILTEDEVDDLVASYSFETTEVGRAFVEQHAPRARLIELLDLVPARRDTYVEVLEYCREPRSYHDFESLLAGRDILRIGPNGTHEAIQPSVFLDKLERAGAIVWDGGWKLTEGGEEYLRELQS